MLKGPAIYSNQFRLSLFVYDCILKGYNSRIKGTLCYSYNYLEWWTDLTLVVKVHWGNFRLDVLINKRWLDLVVRCSFLLLLSSLMNLRYLLCFSPPFLLFNVSFNVNYSKCQSSVATFSSTQRRNPLVSWIWKEIFKNTVFRPE